MRSPFHEADTVVPRDVFVKGRAKLSIARSAATVFARGQPRRTALREPARGVADFFSFVAVDDPA